MVNGKEELELEQFKLMKPWIIFYHTYPWKNRNLSSTVSVLLFQVIYSWNNHQQNEANLLHFPFFFGVCQGLSHLELKGKTLLRMGQAQFGSAAFSAMLCFFGKRWIAGLMAVKISLFVYSKGRRLIMMMVIRIEVDYMINWYSQM